MKSLLKSTYLKTKLLIALLVLCCGSLTTAQAGDNNALRIGLVRVGAMEHRTGLADGYLLVYSATDAFDDGGLVFNSHSSYSVYTSDGHLFKNIENHMSRSDEIPEVVTLPVGSYLIEARSERDGYVRVGVVIKVGQRTIVDLG